MTKQIFPNIERQITILNLDRSLAFALPFEGPGKYVDVMRKILQNPAVKLSLANGQETAFLLEPAYCGQKKFRQQPEIVQLRKTMRNKYLWLGQVNLWVPEKYKSAHGVFVVYDEKGEGLSKELDVGKLERGLRGGRTLRSGVRFSEDEMITFAPRDTYRGGEFTPEDYAKDGFNVANNKVQGAKKLAKVAGSKYFSIKKPYSWIMRPGEEPVKSLSAVIDCFGGGLGFVGICDAYGRGCASGIVLP